LGEGAGGEVVKKLSGQGERCTVKKRDWGEIVKKMRGVERS